MITELSCTNFKSWERIDKMRLAPITGFFGTNSSGKTSILQLLLLMKQTVESTDRLQVLDFGSEKTPANLGGFRDLIYSHETSRTFELSIRWKLANELLIASGDKIFQDKRIGFQVEITEEEKKRLVVDQITYSFSGHDFSMRRKGKTKNFEMTVMPDDFRFVRNPGRVWDLPAPVKCYGFPNEVNARFQNAGFLADLQLELERVFTGAKYLGPLRDYPKRQYPWSGAEPVDMGPRGERVVEALLAARRKGKYLSPGKRKRKETLEQRVAKWLEELGLITTFHVEPIDKEGGNLYRVKVTRSPNSSPVLITDVGFGVSQILPAIVLCYYAPENSIIILEQPEIHLHPAVQAGLADVFVDAVKTRNVQIIFESHSEHLLRRLQLRLAKGDISPKEAALYFCESDNASSKLTQLDVDLFGSIRNWPKDFFGDQFGEMAEITRAGIERSKTISQ